MTASIIVQTPLGKPQQLFLLHHGVGGNAQDMTALGERLAIEFPQALVVSVQAAFPSDFGNGSQWFSIQELTEQNRLQRIAEALPYFAEDTAYWQKESDVPIASTAIIGFSQGAMMALESLHLTHPLAGRIIALSGRFSHLPQQVHERVTLHLIHGKEDAIIHYKNCVNAAEHLIAMNADVTADIVPFLGHQITNEVMDLIIQRLKTHIPKYYWEEAMKMQKNLK